MFPPTLPILRSNKLPTAPQPHGLSADRSRVGTAHSHQATRSPHAAEMSGVKRPNHNSLLITFTGGVAWWLAEFVDERS